MKKCCKQIDTTTQVPIILKQFENMPTNKAANLHKNAVGSYTSNVSEYIQELKKAKREHQVEHYVDTILNIFDEDINAQKEKYCVVNIPFLLMYMLQTGDTEQSEKANALRKQVSDALFSRVKYLLTLPGSVRLDSLPIGRALYETLRRKNGANKEENYGTTRLLELLSSVCLSLMGDQFSDTNIKRSRANDIPDYNRYLSTMIEEMFSTSVITKLLLKNTFRDPFYRGIISLHAGDYIKIHLLATVPVKDYVTLLVSVINDVGTVYRSLYRKKPKELPLAALIALAKKTMEYNKDEALEEAIFFGHSKIWDL